LFKENRELKKEIQELQNENYNIKKQMKELQNRYDIEIASKPIVKTRVM